MQEIPKSATLFPEGNTKRAAALLTLGVDFLSEKDTERVSNTYSELHPYKPGCPGKIAYLLSDRTATGIPAQTLVDAFNAEGFAPAVELDALVEEICRECPALGQRLKDLLPLAIAAYLRGGFENRERVLDLWKKAIPMVLVRRGDNAFSLVNRNAPPHVLKKWGL